MADEFELSRRKILGAVGGVGIASAGAGMGTSAFFNDTESFEGNSVTAGTLDLRVDWQQTYRNGSAGVPGVDYVNAHPDHDGDGIQSIPDQDEDEAPETYEDGNANIQEWLTCETLEQHSPADFSSPNNPVDAYQEMGSLIELEDLKPGDSGEITFSFHLCDNPGCVWLQGGNLEHAENGQNEAEENESDDSTGGTPGDGDGELLENIRVRAWYDIDCDNVYEEGGESTIFAWGTLDEFMNQVSGVGRQLNPVQYGIPGIAPSTSTTTENFCLPLGKLEFVGDTEDELDIQIADDSDGELLADDDPDSLLGEDTVEDENERYKLEDTENGEYVVIDITGYKTKDDGEVIGFWFEVDDVSSTGIGICQVDVKGGGGPQGSEEATERYTFDDTCVPGITKNDSPLYAPVNPGEQQSAVSNAIFYYCAPETEVPSQDTFPCFPGEQTFCVGFEWMLPTGVGNEIQSDSVSFDLGFFTEQARHNDDPGQTF